MKFRGVELFDGLDCFVSLVSRLLIGAVDAVNCMNELFVTCADAELSASNRCFIGSFRFLVLGHFARKVKSHRAADEGARERSRGDDRSDHLEPEEHSAGNYRDD